MAGLPVEHPNCRRGTLEALTVYGQRTGASGLMGFALATDDLVADLEQAPSAMEGPAGLPPQRPHR